MWKMELQNYYSEVDDSSVPLETEFLNKLKEHHLRYSNGLKKPWDASRIHEVIQELQQASGVAGRITTKQYHLLRKFEIVDVCGVQRLILKRKRPDCRPVYVVAMEDYFDILLECHVGTGHGGRDKMFSRLKTRYNIPRIAVEMFIPLCLECDMKRSRPNIGTVAWPASIE